MMKTFLSMIAVISVAACQPYTGRSTNCFGGSSLSFAASPIPPGDCDWVVISD